jgi:hypothetical protein
MDGLTDRTDGGETAYGLDVVFSGRRFLESTSHQRNADGLIEYAVLRHVGAAGWVQVATAWHRAPYRMTSGTRRGPVGHHDAAVMGVSPATQYLRMPHDLGMQIVAEEEATRQSAGDTTDDSPWQPRALNLDGTDHSFLYLELPGAWAATIDLPGLSIGLSGAGIAADAYPLSRVPISWYGPLDPRVGHQLPSPGVTGDD